MFKSSNIRPIIPSDLTNLKLLLNQTQLFPSKMLEEMIHPFFNDPECRDYWHTYEYEGEAVALLYCVHEMLTEGTWNVLAVAVEPAFQNRGIGELLLRNIEQILSETSQSTLLVETSSLPEYEGSRNFYGRIGYHQEAVIRDFYAKGDHKIVFWKSLN